MKEALKGWSHVLVEDLIELWSVYLEERKLNLSPHFLTEISSQIIPNKDEMTVAKVVTHSGNILNVYVVNKNPVLFEDRGGTLYPTVTLLWRFPG